MHDKEGFAILMRNGIPGVVSIVSCAARVTHFRTKISCVLSTRMSLQKILSFIIVSQLDEVLLLKRPCMSEHLLDSCLSLVNVSLIRPLYDHIAFHL